jgi:hypothetical protein
MIKIFRSPCGPGTPVFHGCGEDKSVSLIGIGLGKYSPLVFGKMGFVGERKLAVGYGGAAIEGIHLRKTGYKPRIVIEGNLI